MQQSALRLSVTLMTAGNGNPDVPHRGVSTAGALTRVFLTVGLAITQLAIAQLPRSAHDYWVFDKSFGSTSDDGGFRGIVASGDYIYAGSKQNTIWKYDKNGKLVKTWTTDKHQPNYLDTDGVNLYVISFDKNTGVDGYLEVFDFGGTRVRYWSAGAYNTGGIAVDDLFVYVTSSYYHKVIVFTKMGQKVREWGALGSPAGSFNRPGAIRADATYLYVSDVGNNRIQVFDKEGNFIRQWPGSASRLAIDEDRLFADNRILDRFGQFIANAPCHVGYTDGSHLYANSSTISVYRPSSRAELPPDAGAFCKVLIHAVAQRANVPVLDLDFTVLDGDGGTASVRALAFVDGTVDLAHATPMLSLVDGTEANVGDGVAVGSAKRLSWKMDDDWTADYGNVRVAVLAKDNRDLLAFHFLDLPAVAGGGPLVINRTPVQQSDLLTLWFWLIAGHDPSLRLVRSEGRVYGVGGNYDNVILAEGTTTTEAGADFLLAKMGLRKATADEIRWAKEATTPGAVSQWEPRIRINNATPVKVNEFNFDTGATAGWWVVPVE